MPQPTWNAALSLGIEEMDRQHRRLAEVLDRLCDAQAQNSPRSVLQAIISDLVSYSAFHFDREEQLMRECGFRETGSHAAEHREVLRLLGQFERTLAAGHQELSATVLETFGAFMARHVTGPDRAYAAHYLSAAGELAAPASK
jgi:hemerythrin-like metal-binding protein